jgi:hypothetical protein
MKPINESCPAPTSTAQSARVDNLFTIEYVRMQRAQTVNPSRLRSTTCQIIELDSQQMRTINGVPRI